MDRTVMVNNLAMALPSWADRQAVARAAGLTDVQLTGSGAAGWKLLVEEADAQGRLEALLKAAARRRPRNRALATMAGFPVPDVESDGSGMRWAALIGLAGLAFVARWMEPPSTGDEAVVPVAIAPPPTALPAPPTFPLPKAQLEPKDPALAAAAAALLPQADKPVAATSPAAPAAAPAPAADAVPVPEIAPVPPPSAAPSAAKGEEEPVSAAELQALAAVPAQDEAAAAGKKKKRRSVCNGSSGYAYVPAGGKVPKVGAVWQVPASVNVRADYPRADNDWNITAPVTCVLAPGTRVRVGEKPIPVEGGAVWVPIKDEWVDGD